MEHEMATGTENVKNNKFMFLTIGENMKTGNSNAPANNTVVRKPNL